MKGSRFYWKRSLSCLLVLAMVFGLIPASMSSAAKRVSLSHKKLTIAVGKSKKLKLKNNKKKVKWTVVSGSKSVKLKAKKKSGVTIVAKKKGKAKVQAKAGKKKYSCKVTVVAKKAPQPEDQLPPDDPDDDGSDDNNESYDPNRTITPIRTDDPGNTRYPSGTNNPTVTNDPNNPVVTSNPNNSHTPITSWNPPIPGESGMPTVSASPAPGGNPTTSPGTTGWPSATATPYQTRRPGETQRPNVTLKPGETQKPEKTLKPGETQKPEETLKPGETENPEKTLKPGETENPEETLKPGETENPKKTLKPGETENPEKTLKPGETENPEKTLKPGETENPEETLKPGETQDPNASATPMASATPTAKPTTTPKVSASPTVKPTASPTKAPTASPTVKPTSTPTSTPGTDIDLKGKTPFSIDGRKIALGISKTEALKALGSDASVSSAKSPQGYDVIVYNPGGTYDIYAVLYIKDNVVISIYAVGAAGKVSYGSLVTTGESASTMAGKSGWSAEGTWYKADDGDGAYKYTADNPNANVLAFVDHYNRNQVYGIQVYNTVTFTDLTNPGNCTYNSSVFAEVAKETKGLLLAYCRAYKYNKSMYPMKYQDEVAKIVQAYMDTCSGKNKVPADDLSESIYGIDAVSDADSCGQVIMDGSSDSIGFANDVLEHEESSNYLARYREKENNKYYYKYFGIGTAYITGKTYMYIALAGYEY